MLKTLIFFIILLPLGCFAQFTITGRVLNQADTKPVADASVFLSNATIGGKTAANGTFTFKNVKPGKYQLVISIIGYENYSQDVTINNSNITLPDITIFPKTIGLKEVTVKPQSNANKTLYFDLFKDEFLGTSDFAKECKILNPELLDFDYDDATTTLTASSVDFLEIENPALGYRIKYLLTNFTFNITTKEIHYEGPVLFTEMQGTPKQEHRWQENREQAYEGSMMHLLRSVLSDRLEEEGFRVFRLAVYANPERPADDIIDAKLEKFAVKKSEPGYNADSMSYWKKKLSLPKTLTKLMPIPLTKAEIMTSTGQPGTFALGGSSDGLLINYSKNRHFTETRSLADLNNLNYILNKPNNKELTLLSFDGAYTLFDSNGWIINPNSLVLKGILGLNRVGDLLPLNYEGPQNTIAQADNTVKNIENKIDAFAVSHINEKVHLHLDRQWYGLGDTIWFKAYIVAGNNHQLSALSGVLYTELINAKDSVVNRLTLPLDSGISRGDFVLPYTYKGGTYRLRAYTRLMLNDSAKLYDQKVIIGGINPQPGQTAAINTKHNLSANNLQQKEHGNPDVQFFPEGGDLVNGLRCKVAVKAINREGLAENIQGIIIDQDDNELASFSTQHLGMGQFPLTPQPGKQYQAKIISADGSDFTADLPKAKEAGFTLTVNNAGDSIYVKVAANELFFKNNRNSSFYLIAQCGGKCYYTAAGKLANTVFTAGIDKTRFPTGIVQFTLFSQNGEPLNERIVFVRNNDRLKLAISSAKQSYVPMEKVKIDLDAKKEDKTVSGTFSVAVTDETKVPMDEASEPTILTDLLLTLELKGSIENPNYYFINQDDKTRSDLDLLMLTQGYRRFDWKKILNGSGSGITSKPETALSLSGTIKTLSKKPIANGRVRLTSIKDHFSADTVSDVNGNFKFTNLAFADTTKVIINAQKTNGGKNVLISIKQPSYAAINKTADINYLSDSLPGPVLAALKQTYLAGQQQSLKNVIQLKEVNIKERRNEFFQPKYSENMQFSSNLNGPGNADQVILGDKLTNGGGGLLSESIIRQNIRLNMELGFRRYSL